MNTFRFLTATILITTLLSCNRYGKDYFHDYSGYDDSTYDTTAYDYNDYYSDSYYDDQPTVYQASYTISCDLIATKLAVNFDWKKCYMNGTEWVSLKPHWYPTDTLTLDAKGMNIVSINMQTTAGDKPLMYTYDSLLLKIWLDKSYTRNDTFHLKIDYVAKPNERETTGSDAITDTKGLYFINPDGSDKSKPREMWTQGETEYNSAWFPTIDKPNMKTTIEIAMTVDSSFVTLSNGLMTSSIKNNDGTRTDTWKMDKPIAPYLVMMAAGNFAVTKDHWRNIEVNYYTDPEYAAYAKEIFGNTPEMIEFYSKLLQVDFPWPKFSQIVVHDFVSGAMENTTAVVHMEDLQETHRELIDGGYQDYICHELFHHWFGDYVTCESWSNIPLNESFADYSEYLWLNYKYGRDLADEHLNNDLTQYLDEASSEKKDLIRFYYDSKEDMFDNHSYAKGARVLNMLRNYVGDDAFFAALHLYLTQNAFGTGEIHKLRLAFEQVTGQDLNWFFNQWFLSAGHPVLNIDYSYNDNDNIETVTITQNNNSSDTYYNETSSYSSSNAVIPEVFKLPIKIDLYSDSSVNHYNIVVNEQTQSFSFPAYSKPLLVNVDADKMLLCEKTDNKDFEQYIYQYYHAPLFMDKLEAIQFCSTNQYNYPECKQLLIDALHDKYYGLRVDALEALSENLYAENGDYENANTNKIWDTIPFVKTIMQLAQTDSSSMVRSKALSVLANTNSTEFMNVFTNAMKDSSYQVMSTALESIYSLNAKEGYRQAQLVENEKSKEISNSVLTIYSTEAGPEKNEYFKNLLSTSFTVSRYSLYSTYGLYLSRMDSALQNAGMILLLDGAKNETEWWTRYSAMDGCQTIVDAWVVTKDSLVDAMNNLGSNSALYQTKLNEVNYWSTKIDAMEKQMQAVKDLETDETLKSIWND